MEVSSQNEKEVMEWKLKSQIDYLEKIRLEQSTSAISFYAPPNYDICLIKQFFSSETTKANQIPSSRYKQAKQIALGKIQEMLRDISVMPINGLACFAIPHFIEPNTNQTKRLFSSIELPSPVQEYLYNCSNEIITDPLRIDLRSEPILGYMIIDENVALFAKTQGKQKHILQKINKGGQSQARFSP